MQLIFVGINGTFFFIFKPISKKRDVPEEFYLEWRKLIRESFFFFNTILFHINTIFSLKIYYSFEFLSILLSLIDQNNVSSSNFHPNDDLSNYLKILAKQLSKELQKRKRKKLTRTGHVRRCILCFRSVSTAHLFSRYDKKYGYLVEGSEEPIGGQEFEARRRKSESKLR